jgi:hypothetical protein
LEGTQAQKYVSEWVLTDKEEVQSQEGSYFVDFRHKSAPRKHARQGGSMIGEGAKDFQLRPAPNSLLDVKICHSLIN